MSKSVQGLLPELALYLETYIKRRATQHSCLTSLLGDGDKRIGIVHGEEYKYFLLGGLEQPRQNKNLLYRKTRPANQPKKEPLSTVLVHIHLSFKPVIRGHPSLVSLGILYCIT
jgi:hypothetical protein